MPSVMEFLHYKQNDKHKDKREGVQRRRRGKGVAKVTQVEFELDLEELGGFYQAEKTRREIPVMEGGRGIKI